MAFGLLGLGFRVGLEGMEKKMETTKQGYIGTTIRIHSFMPSSPKASHLDGA